jgi:PAS domain S-box-containing protein
MRRESRIFAVFLTTTMVVVGCIVAICLIGIATIRANGEVASHQILIERLQGTLSTLKDAETGQRGFVLTGNEAYLEPYNLALTEIQNDLDQLTADTQSGELPRDDVDRLKALTQWKLSELRRTIELRRSVGMTSALAEVDTDRGKHTMDEIRVLIGRMTAGQHEAYDATHHRGDAFIAYSAIIVALTTILSLAVLAWAYRQTKTESTAREEAAHALQHQRDLLEVTLASIGDAVIVTDNEGRVTFMNQIAENLTGWNLSDAATQACINIFHIINEESRQRVESPVDRVLRSGVIVGLANHTLLISKDGKELPIDDSGSPIKEPDGTVRGVVLIFRDFSEHKAVEKRLIAAKETSEAANRAKDNFLASLSHELRTPLTPVLATLMTWSADRALPPAMLSGVQMLRRNVELEARLIDDLLDLTRITKGKLSLNLETVDVHELVETVIARHQSEINAKRLTPSVQLAAQRHHAMADAARLQQVFGNILNNAIKFTQEGGHISVTSSNGDDDNLTITFKDDGIGMTEDTIGRLFVPFEQGEEEIVRRAGGLGLGMAISKTLVDAHGGALVAASPGPGRGSIFEVVLSSAEPETLTRLAVARHHDANGHAPGDANILLVEDHADSAEVLTAVLRNMGYRVEACATVAEARKLAREKHFDLLLSDVGLPDGTGLDLIREIRKYSSYPAIALTGFGMDRDIARFKQEGFDEHLTKPVNIEKLETLIRQLLARDSRLG